MANSEQIDSLIKSLSQRMNVSENEIRSAVAGGKYEKLLSKMDASQTGKLQSILSDEEEAKKFLSSPQAQAVMKKLGFHG